MRERSPRIVTKSVTKSDFEIIEGVRLVPNPLISLVGATGFEPATP